jgi:hypothetical protein
MLDAGPIASSSLAGTGRRMDCTAWTEGAVFVALGTPDLRDYDNRPRIQRFPGELLFGFPDTTLKWVVVEVAHA